MKLQTSIKKVLIYRLGSLGDTIVALPCFHLISRAFREAERRVLTNVPVNSKAPPIQTILGESGLVHGYMEYPLRLRNMEGLLHLGREIRRWEPEVLVYLVGPRGQLKAIRDALFFRMCGIKTLIGVPYSRSLQQHEWMPERQQYEREARRLARCLAPLGETKLDDPGSWDLLLTAAEEQTATDSLEPWPGRNRFIACSVGTKVDVSDWGEENWKLLLKELSRAAPECGLVLVGAAEESGRSDRVSETWVGPKLNLCGKLTPRESASVLKRAVLFVGHDSGPMHLAAAVNVPCVAIFSAHAKPGVWFPHARRHKVIYHQTECYGCGLDICERYQKKCISSITVAEVMAEIKQISLEQNLLHESVECNQTCYRK